VESANTQSACAETCDERVEANLKDSGEQSCRGYAWSEKLKSCRVYSGWPILASTKDDSEGYVCYKVRDAWAPAPAPAPAAREAESAEEQRLEVSERTGEGKLSLANLLADPKAVTARRMQVSPFQKGCFQPFDWYILDRSIFVEPDDYKVLLELTKVPSQAASASPSSPAAPLVPRTDLIIERVCLRDCASALRAECKEQSQEASSLASDAREVRRGAEAARARDAGLRCGTALCTLIGEEPLEAAVDPDFWPWALLLGLTAGLLGFVGTSALAVIWRKQKIRPRYQTVEAVKLVYDGEEEDEVVLQSTAGGSLMSVTGNGPALSSWQPSRGPRNPALSTYGPHGAGGSAFGRSSPWGTR